MGFSTKLGFTIDQFYDLTNAQVFYLAKALEIHNLNAAQFQAGIHGAELKNPDPEKVFTKKQVADMEKVRDRQIEKMMQNAKRS